ncbi:MAG TPA: hypothetical protein VFE47_23565 [Tepidisphaeraceae bacterium]|jgi:hypothetical protein|nr:hypothetical protein [Tepidisphaeraceae bacterium]
MSNIPDSVQGIEMPNMKKNANVPIDLMRPGNGTPWEDRGSTGPVGAYFKTVMKSLFSPALLVDHIRRPETTTDSTAFAIVSGAMWIGGVIIYNLYWLWVVLPSGSTGYDPRGVDYTYYYCTMMVQLVMVGVGIFVWLRFGPRLYRALGATELKHAPPSLISNCFNYAMGPSILALIPFIGWILAPIWIVVDLIVAGKRRLYMKGSSAIINMIIISFLALVISVLPVLFVHYVWSGWLDMGGLSVKAQVEPKVTTPHAPPPSRRPMKGDAP